MKIKTASIESLEEAIAIGVNQGRVKFMLSVVHVLKQAS